MSPAKRWIIQELLAVTYPLFTGMACVLVLTIYCVRPDIPSVIYSSLPEKYQTRVWFGVCLCQQANLFSYGILSTCFIFQLHILLPVTLSRVLQRLAKCTTGGGRNVGTASRIVVKLRKIQLVLSSLASSMLVTAPSSTVSSSCASRQPP